MDGRRYTRGNDSGFQERVIGFIGGGDMGDMVESEKLPKSRLAVLPATSHTAVITQTRLLHDLIEQFLKGERPKSFMK